MNVRLLWVIALSGERQPSIVTQPTGSDNPVLFHVSPPGSGG
jgi:hypothetical protein